MLEQGQGLKDIRSSTLQSREFDPVGTVTPQVTQFSNWQKQVSKDTFSFQFFLCFPEKSVGSPFP